VDLSLTNAVLIHYGAFLDVEDVYNVLKQKAFLFPVSQAS